MTHSLSRRRLLAGTAGSAILGSTAAVGADTTQLRLITSWPKNSPGPGKTAERLAQRINTMSNGELSVKVYAAGELVPALEVFDGVANGVADMGHTAAFFWQGKTPAAAFFTAVPFGLTASEHMAWLRHGGGQEAWTALYEPFGVTPLAAGNTGIGMGGWFTRPVNSLADLKGLKYRMPGLGGEVFRRLGAVPVKVAPGEIFTALQTGVVDAAEFLGPWSDSAFGFYKVAKHYYWPGFHEPNGSAECLLNTERFNSLAPHLQEIIRNACAAENEYSLSETQWFNAESLQTLINTHGVDVRPFPDEVINAARRVANEVLAEFADKDELSRAVYTSFKTALHRAVGWSRVSRAAYLSARNQD